MNERESRSWRKIWMGVGTVLVLAILVLLLLTVFRIKSFKVVGNERCSADKIQYDLCYDFATGNTLWFSWKYRNVTADPRAPYLSSIQAKITSPSEVRVIVQEKKLIGYVQYNSNNIYFDSDGVVMEMSDVRIDGPALVTGVTMDEPALYQKLPVTNTALLRTMLSICRLVVDSGLEVDAIDFDDNNNITLGIGTVKVQLGQDEYLEEKVSNLTTIYPKVESQTGTLNMTAFTGRYETVTFSAGTDDFDVNDIGQTAQETGQEGAGEDEGQSVPSGVADMGVYEDPAADEASQGQAQAGDADGTPEQAADDSGQVGLDAFMVFDSSGTLRYDAHVVNGQVVDAYGNPIDGCSVNEDGNVVDAYWNVISPYTGTLAE